MSLRSTWVEQIFWLKCTKQRWRWSCIHKYQSEGWLWQARSTRKRVRAWLSGVKLWLVAWVTHLTIFLSRSCYLLEQVRKQTGWCSGVERQLGNEANQPSSRNISKSAALRKTGFRCCGIEMPIAVSCQANDLFARGAGIWKVARDFSIYCESGVTAFRRSCISKRKHWKRN